MILAFVVSIYVNRVFINQVQLRIRHDLFSAHNIYDDYVENIDQLLQAISIRRTINSPLAEVIESDLGTVFQNIYINSGMDILTLVDMNGKVLYRAHNTGCRGDDLSGLPIIEKVLQSWEPVRGTIILPAEMLEKEGEDISGRAVIDVLPTPLARTSLKETEDRAMMIAAAVPFTSLNNDKLGILLGGYMLNRDDEIVDRIRQEVFEDPAYKHTDAGTATIFFDDLRISTNVMFENNERAVGSRLSEEVYKHVIQRGNVWSDRAFVVSDWYITSYEPIHDIEGQIIGSLYVGVLEAPYKQPQKILMLFFLLMLCLTAISAFLLIFFYMKRMMRPIESIILMCKKMIKGDLSARCVLRPTGEIGLLCSAFDQMADSIEKYEENLQRETQLQIGQSEKLASIGRLAAGIAHEINNPLTSILNFAHLLRQKKTNDKEDLNDLNIIIDETNRVRKIVRELLDFARQSPAHEEDVNINQVLKQLIELIRKQKEFRRIRFIEKYDDKQQLFMADKNQIQQVFLNLILNSAESITGEGTITAATHHLNDKFSITITDTGYGIKPHDLEKIFDPFFTTKPTGTGTGLGLSVSYGIVKQFGGEISCESKEGEGTNFTVTFPYNNNRQDSQT